MRRTEVVTIEVTYDTDEYPDVEHVLWGTDTAPGASFNIIAPASPPTSR